MRDYNFLKQELIAHRGLHDGNKQIIENSIEAFARAINKNYIIELDVHLLKDNTVVVFHDDNLKRLTKIDKKVKHYTYDEIKNIKLGKKDTYIPKFTEILDLVNGKVPLLIELKSDNKVGKLEKELVKILNKYKGNFAVQSFNPFSVMWFKKHYPLIIRGQLASNFKDKKMNIIKRFILKNMVFNFITKPDFISYNINSITPNKIEKIKKNRLILGWTVRTEEEYNKLKNLYNNLICELFI